LEEKKENLDAELIENFEDAIRGEVQLNIFPLG